MEYQELNAEIINKWCQEGWEWGQPITHEIYENAKKGLWGVYLTPTKLQQMPVFTALGAACTVLDYSGEQCRSEKMVAEREGYSIEIIQEDMSKKLPFDDESFDIIFHPVSNCYVEKVDTIFKECYRVLKKGGIFLGGYDLGINYVFDDEEKEMIYTLPFNPLKNPQHYQDSIKNDWGIAFSHTLEEQIGGQLKAGFTLTDLYEDTNSSGRLYERKVPSFIATRCIK